MQIKQITKNYFEQKADYFVDLWLKIWDGTPWADFKIESREEEKDYFRKFLKDGLGLMSLDNKQITGLIFGLLNQYQKPKNLYEKNLFEKITKNYDYATIDELVVTKKYRNQNIGKKLLDQYIKTIKDKNIKKIFLYTDKDSKSHSFYQRNGFIKIGKINKISRPNLSSSFETRVYYYKNL